MHRNGADFHLQMYRIPSAERVPLIIAARNEEASIAAALLGLDPSTVAPLVIVNDSSDRTAEIATATGAQVVETEQPGKMPAIQLGLRELGKVALGPVLYMDADSRPMFPRQWAATMLSGLGTERVASGLYIADTDLIWHSRWLMSALRVANVLDKQLRGISHASGANMVTQLQSADSLEAVLALDARWPGEDIAMAEAIAGPGKKRVVLHPYATIRTSSRYLPNPLEALRHGRDYARATASASRVARTPVDTAPQTDERVA